jgi:hypothetical protein
VTKNGNSSLTSTRVKYFSIRPRDDGQAARRVVARPVSRAEAWFEDEVAIG